MAMTGRPEKGRRSHAFGGCGTCRRRHVKCDQLRPICLTCTALGVACEGFSTQLKWMTNSDDQRRSTGLDAEHGTEQVTRRHLFTERSREAMSNALQRDLTFKSVDSLLTELDAKSKEVAVSTAGGVVVGPFSVLDFQSSATIVPSNENEFLATTSSAAALPVEEAINAFGDTSPHTVESLDSLNNMDEFLNWSDLFELEFSTVDMSQSNVDEFSLLPPPPYEVVYNAVDHLPFSNDMSGFIPSNQHKDTGIDRIISESTKVSSRTVDEAQISATILQRPSMPHDFNVGDAQLLLRHFQDVTIPQMSSLPPSPKTPWRLLTVPCAVQTLADVGYMSSSNTSHAALSNLLAVLAISARHMSNQKGTGQLQMEYWRVYSSAMINQAKEHSQWSLQNETQGKGKAKYKDQLMAILAMMAHAVSYDRQEDARCYMVDAERLLRLRGLAKRTISRKARMLHHLYTWFRIVGESTYVLRDYENTEMLNSISGGGDGGSGSGNNGGSMRQRSSANQRVMATTTTTTTTTTTRIQQTSGPNARLDDFLRLEQNISDTETTTRGRQKEQRAGLRDIHLEDSREWSSTMYLQLYGISETWLSLMSQTTRLANVIDSMQAQNTGGGGRSSSAGGKRRRDNDGDHHDHHLKESVRRRTERLENLICSYASSNQISKPPLRPLSRPCPRPSGSSVTVPTTDTTEANNEPDEGGGEEEEGHPHRHPQNHGQQHLRQRSQRHMVRALDSALVIFFYRRIRRVNPWILQPLVDDVVAALEDFDRCYSLASPSSTPPVASSAAEGEGEVEVEVVGSPWPAFMAGCEATDPRQREWLKGWLERAYRRTGFERLKSALDVMGEVWRGRRNGGKDWIQICKERKIYLMLS